MQIFSKFEKLVSDKTINTSWVILHILMSQIDSIMCIYLSLKFFSHETINKQIVCTFL